MGVVGDGQARMTIRQKGSRMVGLINVSRHAGRLQTVYSQHKRPFKPPSRPSGLLWLLVWWLVINVAVVVSLAQDETYTSREDEQRSR